MVPTDPETDTSVPGDSTTFSGRVIKVFHNDADNTLNIQIDDAVGTGNTQAYYSYPDSDPVDFSNKLRALLGGFLTPPQ